MDEPQAPTPPGPALPASVARWIPAALFLLLPGILLLPALRPGTCLSGGDYIAANYHVRGTVGKALREGRLPTWDPYVMCGTPLLAAMHAGVLYPLTWPVALLSPGPFWTATVWVHLALAGAFAFAWLRRGLGLGSWSSLVGALLFMLSGFVTLHIFHGHVGHVSTFPWAAAVLWRLERFLAGPGLRRGLLLAAVLALMLLAGFPQFVFILGFAVAARLLQVVAEDRSRLKVAAQATGWLALAGLLAAPQLLPTLEMIPHVQRAVTGKFEFVTSFSLSPSDLPTALVTYFGDSRTLPVDSTAFVGISGLVLAAFGALGRRRGRHLWTGLAVLGIVLSLGHHTPVFKGFYSVVPGVSLFREPARYLMLTTIALAPLAALGFERLWNGEVLPGRGRLLAALLGVALLSELVITNSRHFVGHPVADMEWPAEFASSLKSHPRQPFRVATVTMEQVPSIGKCQLAEIDHIGGYESMMLKRYSELCNVARGKPASDVITAMAIVRPAPIFDLLGARLWIVPGPRREPPGWTTVGQLPSAFIYENPAALPRAFLVGRSVVLPSPEERLRVLADPAFDPRKVVVLESGAPSDTDATGGVVRLAARKPGLYALQTECSTDAVLVLSETWYPGWRVTVDGAPAELLPADHLVQAVRLPAGKHEVRFEYRSTYLGLGFALAAAGALVPLSILAMRRKSAGRGTETPAA